jgi:glycosyltransferase involved in cell wall biosynthesis
MRVRVILNEPFAGIGNGWSLRYINLLLELSAHAELDIFAPGESSALQAALPNAHVHTTGDVRSAPAPKKNLLRFLRSVLAPRVDNLQLGGFVFFPSLFEQLQRDTQRYHADVFFHISAVVFYGAAARSPLRICDFCDSRIRALRSQIATSGSVVERAMLRLDSLYTRRVKQRLVPEDVKIVAITERDCDEIRHALPGRDVTCVPNGVRSISREQLEADISQRHASPRLIFFGTLNFPPNADAARRLLTSIWPIVHAQRPDLELHLVGRHPTAELQALASSTPGAHLQGDVPAIEPHLRGAVLSVCPMFMGAGIKNKILESLAVGLPIVATREAVEGIDFVAGKTGWLAEAPAELARAILDGVGLPLAEYRQLCLAAHELALRSSWASAAAPIVELLRAEHRPRHGSLPG